MIKGIGCDIVSIQRIKGIIEKFGDKFLKRVFVDEEIKLAGELDHNYYSYFAKRFAAKEALAKALGCGIGEVFAFRDCAILNMSSGSPYVVLNRGVAPYKIHISLADEREYAIAYVVLEE